METVIPRLYAAAPDKLPFDRSLEIRSFLVHREAGTSSSTGATRSSRTPAA
jgi:hypothetical protein